MSHVVGRLVTKVIEKSLDQLREKIISGGYENWTYKEIKKEFSVSDEVFKTQLRCDVKNFLFNGASKFVTKRIDFDLTTSTVFFDVLIPKLFFAIGDSTANVVINNPFFDFTGEVNLKGWIAFTQLSVRGHISLDTDKDGNIIAKSVKVDIQLNEVQSKIHVSIMDTDWSESVNSFLGNNLSDLINMGTVNFKDNLEEFLKGQINPLLAQL